MLKKTIVAVLLFFLLFISGCAPIFDLLMPIEGIPMDVMPGREELGLWGLGELSGGDLGNGAYVSIEDARVTKDDYGNYYLVVSYDFWHGHNVPMSFNSLVRTDVSQIFGRSDFKDCEKVFNEHILSQDITWRSIKPNLLVEVEVAFALHDTKGDVMVTATDLFNMYGQSRWNTFDVPTLIKEAEAAGMLEGETSSYD